MNTSEVRNKSENDNPRGGQIIVAFVISFFFIFFGLMLSNFAVWLYTAAVQDNMIDNPLLQGFIVIVLLAALLFFLNSLRRINVAMRDLRHRRITRVDPDQRRKIETPQNRIDLIAGCTVTGFICAAFGVELGLSATDMITSYLDEGTLTKPVNLILIAFVGTLTCVASLGALLAFKTLYSGLRETKRK